MKLKSFILAAAAVTLPVVATAQANLPVRAVADVEEGNELAGGPGIIIALLGGAAIIAGIVIASDNEDDDAPASP